MDSTEPSPSKKSSQSNAYMKYGGLAVQLLAVIGFFGWLGHLLDNYLTFKFPVFMLLLGFLGFGAMMYQVYRSVNRE